MMNSMKTDFCNVCREAIVKKTCTIMHQTYSFTDFLQKNNPSDISLKSIDVKSLATLKMIPHDMVFH